MQTKSEMHIEKQGLRKSKTKKRKKKIKRLAWPDFKANRQTIVIKTMCIVIDVIEFARGIESSEIDLHEI